MEDCPPTRAEAWLEEHGRDLAGLPRADAVAVVEGAGLRAAVLDGSGPRSPEIWEDRVILRLAGDATVSDAAAG
ncbi:hypothetical protein [Amnibacterium kyonggiense]